MWYQNIGSMFYSFVTKHACDRRTDRITIPKTALAYLLRAVKNDSQGGSQVGRQGGSLSARSFDLARPGLAPPLV